ncbi:ribosomal protein S30 [Hamiltosporidium tvaerminnensis]|uniref:40S ribosomal protein S30 n=3 Tax=Hamiltosporidium TaxID=1176354 RepID=A0A4Q9KVG2_9MICR|nr:ribosomal protein S30 [Hamiltosporidium tvaerminnensis]TBT98848.1 ribosomal protein S30 [Hamiltosporidium tvaerminnensis]TBU06434.1 ribosomal protein S30 [Hamiltosporidium magnivora]
MAKVVSLNRAGKVKGQTPKVEKQEKEKGKTGRAKKRMLYEHRSKGGLFETGKMKMNPQN